MRPQLTWEQFKTFVFDKRYVQFVENDDPFYTIYLSGGSDLWTTVAKDGGPDFNDFILNYAPYANGHVHPGEQPPFASKILCGKKLFKRVHGLRVSVVPGDNLISFPCPVPNAKVEAIQIIGAEVGDSVDLTVHDTPDGDISGIPGMRLNQFGFGVNVGPGTWDWRSKYDADLIQGLELRLLYRSVSAKNIGINFDLNEVK